jgi:hypothetical protein
MKLQKLSRFEWMLFVVMIVLAVASRFWIETPNFKPIAAFALLGGFAFRQPRIGIAAVLVAMLLADFCLGFYQWQVMFAVYGSFAACVGLGFLIREQLGQKIGVQHVVGVTGASLAMSTLFFATTNFAVWSTSGWYATDLGGLAACYSAAIPFYRYMIQGDLLFSLASFGTYAVAVAMMNRVESYSAETMARPLAAQGK